LQRNWRKSLCAPLELERLLPTQLTRAPVEWAEEESGRCRLSKPLTQHPTTMARDFSACPMAGIPEACESVTKMQAAYRFLPSGDVEFETLLLLRRAATEERISDMGKGSVVLVAQDTTSVNSGATAPSARPNPRSDLRR